MKNRDEIAEINRNHWNKMVNSGCDFTLPWLDLDRDKILRFLEKGTNEVPYYLQVMYPLKILSDIQNKKVLCLGAGGGQQSVVFALLGAKVTVADISERQLEMDKKAAEHYGYHVELIHADMRNLSAIADNSFDLVFGTGMCYIDDVKHVYSEVNRILKLNGIFRVNFSNPATEFVDWDDWDGKGYTITRAYKERIRRNLNGPIEFRHTLQAIFNGLINCGFCIRYVEEDPRYKQESNDPPGSWTHWLTYIIGFAILAQKKINFS